MNRWLTSMLGAVFCLPLAVGAGNATLAGESKQTAYNLRSHCHTCLRLVPSEQSNQQGNPIYLLEVYHNGKHYYTFEAVAGRAYTQTRNRDRSGTEAPLPDGKYTVSNHSVPGTLAEVGGRFIPVSPRFRTGRTALGIHYDPSYNLANGEDGTAGCIGLATRGDFETLRHFIVTYQPQLLIVDIQ